MRSRTFTVARPLAAVVSAFMLTLAVPSHLLGAAQVWLVTFTIDDNFPSPGGAGARSDGLGAYTDYRLLGEENPPSGCIEASPTSTGHLHAVLNRRIDDTSTRCNPNGSDRQFRLRLVDAAGACSRLQLAYGASNVITDGNGNCDLVYTDNPRVRVADLFKKGAPSTTPVAFLTAMFQENTVSYEIRMLDPVPMTAPDPNTRVVEYPGQAYLLEFGNGKTKAVEAPFDLPFRMTFVRTAQQ